MHRSRLIGLVIAFLVGFLLLFGIREALASTSSLGFEPRSFPATSTGTHAATLSVSAWPDSYQCHGSDGGMHPDWVTYCPSTSWVVPAHSVITITIKQYDTGGPLHNGFFQRVRGTIGDTETVDGKVLHGLNSAASEISHTLTIQSVPDSPAQMFVSVPVAAIPDNRKPTLTLNGQPYAKPAVTTFRFQSGVPGRYVWHCYDPCGNGLFGIDENFGGAMATTGYMAGTLTVV